LAIRQSTILYDQMGREYLVFNGYRLYLSIFLIFSNRVDFIGLLIMDRLTLLL
jgi:hypothetical protein